MILRRRVVAMPWEVGNVVHGVIKAEEVLVVVGRDDILDVGAQMVKTREEDVLIRLNTIEAGGEDVVIEEGVEFGDVSKERPDAGEDVVAHGLEMADEVKVGKACDGVHLRGDVVREVVVSMVIASFSEVEPYESFEAFETGLHLHNFRAVPLT